MKFLSKILITLAAIFALTGLSAAPAFAAGEDGSSGSGSSFSEGVCNSGIDEDLKQQAGCSESRELPSVGATLINVVIGLVIAAAVIVVIIGGIQYATSLGDPGKIKSARNIIIYAVVAVIVALFAWFIVHFIIDAVPAIGGSSSDDTSQTE